MATPVAGMAKQIHKLAATRVLVSDKLRPAQLLAMLRTSTFVETRPGVRLNKSQF